VDISLKHHYADDGRIMTPPRELEPLLKGSFPAFYEIIGHIRFFYIADENWNGEASLIFAPMENRSPFSRLTTEFSILTSPTKASVSLTSPQSALYSRNLKKQLTIIGVRWSSLLSTRKVFPAGIDAICVS